MSPHPPLLSHLHRADGSATHTHNNYTILCAVNGPLEVQRRDERPDEATLEINVRPAAGVGTPRERHLETLLHSALRSIVLTRRIPRSLVQVTLQITGVPEEEEGEGEGGTGVERGLALLPHLLHTALLALLSASVPLKTVLTAVLVAIPAREGAAVLVAPTAGELLRAKPIRSAHVFAFSGDRRLLLNESDGAFSYEEWEDACQVAEEACCKDEGGVGLTEGMEVDGAQGNLEDWLREVVKSKVVHEQRWKVAK